MRVLLVLLGVLSLSGCDREPVNRRVPITTLKEVQSHTSIGLPEAIKVADAVEHRSLMHGTSVVAKLEMDRKTYGQLRDEIGRLRNAIGPLTKERGLERAPVPLMKRWNLQELKPGAYEAYNGRSTYLVVLERDEEVTVYFWAWR